MIIGSGGAGKSTLARELGSILGLEVIHLDTLYWHPGWVETPKLEWQSIIQDLTLRESWIMDGNYSGTLDIRLAIADTVIFLDFPRMLCLWRVIKRSWQYAGQSRPDMASGCPERLTWEFLKFVWTYPITRRPNILNKLSQLPPNQQVIILHKPEEVREFVQTISLL
ncbi:topology modulation protein [Nostoc sp. NIES-4103]|nr:topology modulation protein [Nostoc sp. NIES-4103]